MSVEAEPTVTAAAPVQPTPGGWAPMRYADFRRLWLGQFTSNVGSWMQTVAAQPSQVDAFLALTGQLRRMRRRTGAVHWHLHRDVDDPSRFTEDVHRRDLGEPRAPARARRAR